MWIGEGLGDAQFEYLKPHISLLYRSILLNLIFASF